MTSKRIILVLMVMACMFQMAALQLSVTVSAAVPLEASPSWATTGNYDSDDVALGDFDHDGDLDLASFGENNVLVYRNQGGALETSAFWTSSDSTSGVTGSLVWADINNDNFPELFTSIGMFANTAGTLSATAGMTFLSSADAFTLGDVNDDGYADLLVGDTDLIELYANSGGVIDSTPDWNTTEPNSPKALALGDMDNDDFDELAVGSSFDPLRIYDNVGGSLKNVSAWNSTLMDNVGCLTWGDIAGDGFPELFACTQPLLGGAPNRIYKNQAGTLENYPSWNSTETSYATEARFADLQGDSDLDLLVSNVPYMSGIDLILGKEMVYLNDNGILDETKDWEGAYQDTSYGLDVGLVDADAYLDMVVASSEDLFQTYPGRALMYKGLAPNRLPQITSVTVDPTQPSTGQQATISVSASDADGDTLTYDFSVTAGNGTIVSETGSAAVWKAPDVVRDCIVNISVSDGKGGFAYRDFVITVIKPKTDTGTPFFSFENVYLLLLLVVIIIVVIAAVVAMVVRRRKKKAPEPPPPPPESPPEGA